jgi:hypothetical protein
MLCADGKKVTFGIDSKGGDVDMFGHEGGQTLTERKQKLNRNLALIKEVKERLQNSKTDRIDRDMEESVVFSPAIPLNLFNPNTCLSASCLPSLMVLLNSDTTFFRSDTTLSSISLSIRLNSFVFEFCNLSFTSLISARFLFNFCVISGLQA